jgi:hypothetical protein
MGLVVDDVRIEGANATIDTHPFAVHLEQPGHVEAHVAALDLAAFLDAKAPGGLKDFGIAIREGKVYVEATARVIVEVRAKVVCTLRIHEKKQLFVDLESVDVMGIGAKGMVQGQLDQINPVLDASQFPLNVEFEEVIADHDRLILKGAAAPA